MRIVIETPAMDAVAFTVPVAELVAATDLLHNDVVRELGPDPLADDFRADEATTRIQARADTEIADALVGVPEVPDVPEVS